MTKINVNIDADSPAELRAAILELIGGSIAAEAVTITPAVAEAVTEVVTKTATKSAKKIAEKPVVVEEETVADIAELTKVFTAKEITDRLVAIAGGGKKTEVIKLMGRFGVSKMSELKEENFAEIMQLAEAL